MKKHFTSVFLFLFSTALFAQEKTFSTTEVSVNEFLHGTLYTPEKAKKTDLVILIAGSGPTNRDGNSMLIQGDNNSLKYLAEGLAKNGISVYSYDKRFFGLAKQNKTEEAMAMLFNDFVDDAVKVAHFFKSQKKYKQIIFAGHSEGSLIGMIASERARTNKFISIAGAGNSLDIVIENQIAQNAPFLVEETQAILKELRAGNTIEVKNPFLEPVFSETLQPFIISLIKNNPQEEIKKLKIPVLIINGTSDLQVSEAEAQLLKQAKPEAQYLIIEKMNHVLKEVNDISENQKSYTDPNLPVMPELIEQITKFITKK